MNFQKGVLWVLLSAFATLSQPALAKQKMLFEEMDPGVSYSGWRIVQNGSNRVKMREYRAPGKQRFEMNAQGQDMVMIMQMDTGKGWMLMPQMKAYMETSVSNVNNNSASGFEVLEQTKLGQEQVNGHATTKYKAVFRDAQGRRGNGFFWVTSQHGIPIKMDMTQQTNRGQQRVQMELTELEIGSQPQSLFEVPDSYRALPGGMAGMFTNPSGTRSGGSAGNDYMAQLEARRAQQANEARAQRAREQQEKTALAQLTVDYLSEGCWFDREGQIKVNADGSYAVGTHAGRGYAMERMGDSIEEFRQRYDGLVSKSDERFVVRSHGREFGYDRGKCVTAGNHSIAGPGTDRGKDTSGKSAVDEAADKIKEGIGSFFD